MKTADPRRAAQDSIRDQLLEAARRDLAVAPRRRRFSWRWRGAGLAVVALLGVSVAAGATDLISVGAPLPDGSVKVPRYAPRGGSQVKLVVKAPDPDSELAWGAGIYTSSGGQPCIIAGQVRGVSLGRVRDGRFRPYEQGTTGACGSLRHLRLFSDALTIRETPPRTILYGRAQPSVRSVSINDDGRRRSVRPGPGGAFLFVVRGLIRVNGTRLRDLDLRPDPA
ncbi:hypothetical protein OM076_07380 [Solirubrobacter ginsenosidimutans]|uniref:Uncharacterized protein n=1 Tax=Solirubrobacter ginsenosidimutans TaxID=490573 RepID=A0A9X3S3X5_9ACTN|nr:hypothetical protein [Solirubrobacter ginsenosidimutans]MDA0160078.1 hypothetical protein [Solirubrobacter ginsenosidimutans]